MTILQAIILGIVQGLTEFIPVSSTAHLVFAARLTNLYAGVEQNLRAQQTTATIAVVQLGTLAAVIVYFARDIWNISLSFVRDHWRLLANRRAREAANGPFVGGLSKETLLGWYIIMGTLPISIIGLLFKKEIEGTLTKNLWIIATMLIVIAILLLVAERVGTRRRTMNDLGWRDALIVGCAQVLALIPGASRSGSTIMGGLFAGLTREAAARFSFLLSIPAIFASGLLELRETLSKLPPNSFFALAVATVVSGLVGYASIWFLLRYLRTHSTRLFIGYRLALGILLLALLTAGVIDPLGTP